MPPSHRKSSDTSAAVDQFMAATAHPLKAEIQALRELILGTHPAIAEGIKWNAPSYRTHEYFATTNLRDRTGIGVILHLGAKVRNETVTIDDPAGLLTWLGTDRASVSFAGMAGLRRDATAFRAIVAQWIAAV